MNRNSVLHMGIRRYIEIGMVKTQYNLAMLQNVLSGVATPGPDNEFLYIGSGSTNQW